MYYNVYTNGYSHYPCLRGQRVQLPQNQCVNLIISKSRLAIGIKHCKLIKSCFSMRQASSYRQGWLTDHISFKTRKTNHTAPTLNTPTSNKRHYSTWNLIWGRNNVGILSEMLVCEDMTSCTGLAHYHPVDQITTFCHCSAYYTVVASIFLVSAASCSTIHGIASVRSQDLLRLIFSHFACNDTPSNTTCAH